MNCDTAAAFSSTSSETGKNTRYVFGKNSDRHVGETQLVEHFHPHNNLLQETVVGTHNTKISVSKLAKLTFDKLLQINNNNDTTDNNLTVSSFSEKYFSTSLAHVISRPHHMFGAEMGFNANGVTLGNEAVFCPPKIPSAKHSFRQKQLQPQSDDAGNEDEIIGMDALRLAVSFAQDSVFACAIIAAMTEFFDVGNRGFRGDCGDGNGAVEHYHNAFLICDPERILKMFCLGEHWCIVDENENNNKETASSASWHASSISNFLPFGITKSKIIATSSKFYEFAKFDITANDNENNCLRTNIMPSSSTWFKLMDYFANGAQRECVTKCLLQEGLNRKNVENVDLADFCFSAMTAALRAHGSAEESKIRSLSTATGNNNNCQGSNCGEIGVPLSELSSLSQISVCMHGGVGPVRVNQTANSLIVVVEKKGFAGSKSIRAFSTEAPNPCISVFTPILFHSHNNNVNNNVNNDERARFLGLTNARRCSVITEAKTKRRWGQFEEIIRRCTILGVEQYLNEFAKECRRLEQSILTSTSRSGNCSLGQLHPFEAFDCGNTCETRKNLDKQISDQVLDLLHEWWKRTSSVNNLKTVEKEDEGVVISIFQWMLRKK